MQPFWVQQMSASGEIRKLITTCKLLGIYARIHIDRYWTETGHVTFSAKYSLRKIAEFIMNQIVENYLI